MALQQRDVEITSPCPVKLDPARTQGGSTSWYCGHCDKSVHVLSNMTEREARTLLTERVGEDLCVSYVVRSDGSIRFAPEPAPVVPVSSLTRRRSLAAASLSVALAACTPHERHELRPEVQADTPVVQGADFVTIPDAPCETKDVPPPVEQDERVVDGGIGLRELPPPREIAKPGGLKVRPLPEAEETSPQPRRGGMRRRQLNDSLP